MAPKKRPSRSMRARTRRCPRGAGLPALHQHVAHLGVGADEDLGDAAAPANRVRPRRGPRPPWRGRRPRRPPAVGARRERTAPGIDHAQRRGQVDAARDADRGAGVPGGGVERLEEAGGRPAPRGRGPARRAGRRRGGRRSARRRARRRSGAAPRRAAAARPGPSGSAGSGQGGGRRRRQQRLRRQQAPPDRCTSTGGGRGRAAPSAAKARAGRLPPGQGRVVLAERRAEARDVLATRRGGCQGQTSANAALHLQLDEPVQLHRVLHRQLAARTAR